MDKFVRDMVDASEATFAKDDATGKMTGRVTIIKAGRAKNPRNYRASALKRAAEQHIYDGLRMFVNHSDKPPVKRSMDEMVAAVESTEWDPKQQAIMGNVEYFDEKFFDKAQRAAKYMGVSADHRIRVNYVKEGTQTIEDVTEIAMARSVDFVVFPSAGGELLTFARESEGADQVEWSEVTAELLKEHAPEVVKALEAEMKPAKESVEDPKKETAPVAATPEQIAQIVQEQVTKLQQESEAKAEKRTATIKSVRERVTKSGLPNRTRDRIINAFEGELDYDEKAVDEAINDAKEELKEAGVRGPRIEGMGPSGKSDEADPAPHTVSARESVEAHFGIGLKKTEKKDPATSGKES